METRRRWCAVAGVVAFACVVSACGSSSSAAPASSAAAPGSRSIVALGDSVPRGTACSCTPYPALTADSLTSSTGRTATATNDSVAGFTTSDVLDQVDSDADVANDVRSADVVEIEVGANDVAHSNSCGSDVACYEPHIPTIEKNLTSIVDRVHVLTAGHKVLVVLLDYWSVWLGGKYAQAKGHAYVAAAEEVTDRVNTVVKSTASRTGSAYVDLRAAFKGPDYAYDETQYLSSDGDHPNAAGHRQIAAAAVTVIEKSLGA